jgi:homopolymeric O-antigen transport system ATP-binding protein
LIIDEVLAVGDDMFRRRCFRRLEEFQEKGKTVLFVSHNLGTVTSICERALLLDKGEIIEVGSAKMIADTYTRLIAEKEETNLKKKSENNYLDKDYNRSKDERFEEPKDNSKPEYRYGTGDAKLLDVKMINEEGLFGNVFNQGDYFTMRISIQFNKYMKEPGAGYRIRTIKGVDVSGTNTFITGKSIGEVNSGDIVTIEFKQIMILNPGSYSLSSGVVENIMDRQIVHDRRMDVIVFKVIGKLRSTGIFDIGSEIKVTLDKIDDKGVKASKN